MVLADLHMQLRTREPGGRKLHDDIRNVSRVCCCFDIRPLISNASAAQAVHYCSCLCLALQEQYGICCMLHAKHRDIMSFLNLHEHIAVCAAIKAREWVELSACKDAILDCCRLDMAPTARRVALDLLACLAPIPDKR